VHANGALLMSDATQAIGKIPVDVNALGIDLMAFSAHKFHGPKGVGALYVRRRNPRAVVAEQIHGGGHERNMRSGTLNVPGIVGMGKAAELAQMALENEDNKVYYLRGMLETELLALPGVRRNGHEFQRLPNTSNLSFADVEAEALIGAMPRLAISTGSACTSALIQPSHVLSAMGIKDDEAFASIRFSLSRNTTIEEIADAIVEVRAALEKLRG
jgi:cysteine desulfurase